MTHVVAMTVATALGAAIGLAGCAVRSAGPPPRAAIALDDAIARFCDPAATEVPPARAGATPRTVVSSRRGADASRSNARGGERALAGSSRRRVDVRLHDADLENALRMLADAAHVPLVVDGDVQGTVTIALRQVDPLSALTTIASAHGASVEVAGGAVVVHAR